MEVNDFVKKLNELGKLDNNSKIREIDVKPNCITVVCYKSKRTSEEVYYHLFEVGMRVIQAQAKSIKPDIITDMRNYPSLICHTKFKYQLNDAQKALIQESIESISQLGREHLIKLYKEDKLPKCKGVSPTIRNMQEEFVEIDDWISDNHDRVEHDHHMFYDRNHNKKAR
ncbi:hypothetical protein ACPV5J_07515 [Vibrio rotiferianus]|uniref:hypothetical protein n=1 Tax=Vibrio rotiferianus TaxID=190895 RepID=UPI00406A5A56